MNEQSISATSGSNGASTARDLFALTDEQILEIEPEAQDVEVSAPGPEAKPETTGGSQAPASTENLAATNAGPFSGAEEVRALAELYPGGIAQAKTAAERARTLDEIDAAYFGAAGGTPEQASASRAQLAQRMLREDPVAFRELVFAGLRALEETGKQPGSTNVAAVLQMPGEDARLPFASTQGKEAASTGASQESSSADRAARLNEYAAFEKTANEDLERSVGSAIERTLEQALPSTARADSGALKGRLTASIRQDIEKALQGDRQLGEQVAQILSSKRFNDDARAQVVRLIGERARQLVPVAARRVINEWTQTTLATHRSRTQQADTASVRREVGAVSSSTTNATRSSMTQQGRAGATRQSEAAQSGVNKPRGVDYRKLSDEQILDL